MNSERISMRLPVVLLLLYSLISYCSTDKKSDEQILVHVKDKTISVDEFIRRSELTPRPPYCSGNSDKDKRIILNSLIAEKLVSLDIQERQPDIERDEGFQDYLKGYREQEMRMLLYREKILDKMNLDSTELIKNFNMAGIEYVLKHYTIYDSVPVKSFISNRDSFEEIFKQRLGSTPIPRKTIRWQDQEDLAIHQRLFATIVPPGSVFGPIKVADGGYLVFKIDSIKEIKAVTLQEVQERKRLVSDKLKTRKAAVAWLTYINRIMEDKKISFFMETLETVGSLFENIYFSADSLQMSEIEKSNRFSLLKNDRQLMVSPLYRIGDRIWTVGEFKRLIISHPLVYRSSELSRENYKFYFQKAVIDLMGDFFLTEEAYEMKLDKDERVLRTVAMWQDALIAKRYMSNHPEVASLDDYIHNLVNKYKHQIHIDIPAFNHIKLTQSSMMATQSLQPHALTVPPFPQLTQDDFIYNQIRKKAVP
jgi:hypothetical protein